MVAHTCTLVCDMLHHCTVHSVTAVPGISSVDMGYPIQKAALFASVHVYLQVVRMKKMSTLAPELSHLLQQVRGRGMQNLLQVRNSCILITVS